MSCWRVVFALSPRQLFESAPLDVNAGNALCQPAVLYRVICFAGGVDTLGTAAMTCRRMRLLLENALLWKFCVRFGKVPARLRPRWWACCLRIPEVISPTTYQQLVAKGLSGKFMRPIERDIRRSFTDSMKKPLYISSQLRQAYGSNIAEAAASYGSSGAGSLGSTGLAGPAIAAAGAGAGAGAEAGAGTAPLRITTGAADDEDDDRRSGSGSGSGKTPELWPPVSKSPHVALLERIIGKPWFCTTSCALPALLCCSSWCEFSACLRASGHCGQKRKACMRSPSRNDRSLICIPGSCRR